MLAKVLLQLFQGPLEGAVAHAGTGLGLKTFGRFPQLAQLLHGFHMLRCQAMQGLAFKHFIGKKDPGSFFPWAFFFSSSQLWGAISLKSLQGRLLSLSFHGS